MREEVAKESGMFIPRQPMISPTYMMTDPFFGPVPRAAMNGGYPGPQRMGRHIRATDGTWNDGWVLFQAFVCLAGFFLEQSGPWLIVGKMDVKMIMNFFPKHISGLHTAFWPRDALLILTTWH